MRRSQPYYDSKSRGGGSSQRKSVLKLKPKVMVQRIKNRVKRLVITVDTKLRRSSSQWELKPVAMSAEQET